MTPQEFSNGLHHYFNLQNTQKYLCPTSLIRGGAFIDIIKFDEWLHLKHGEYEAKGLSMKDLIEKEYGKDASAFIQSLF